MRAVRVRDAAQPSVQGRGGIRSLVEGRPELRILFAAQTIVTAGVALSFPFLALYLHRERGIGMGAVGLLLGLNVLLGSTSQAFGGELSDLFGRQRVMRLALSVRAAVVLGLAGAIRGRWPIAPLLGLLVLSTFLGHFFEPAARAWIADHLPPEERVRGYGLLRIAVNLGWAAGPAVGGRLAGESYAGMFVASAALCGLCAALVAWKLADLPGPRAEDRFSWSGMARALAEPRFRRACGLALALGAIMSQLIVSLSIHATQFAGLSEQQVGWLFSLNGAMVVLLQSPLGARWSRLPLTTELAAGCALYALGYGLAGFAPGLSAMAAAVAVVTLGEIAVTPGMHALWANLAPARERGRYLGVAGLSFQVGSAIGPLLGGLALQHVSPRFPPGPWLAVAALGALTAAGYRSLGRELSAEEQGFFIRQEGFAS